jgi:phosphohistidine phosphatase SixA
MTRYKIFPYPLLKQLRGPMTLPYPFLIDREHQEWVKKLQKGGYIVHLRHAERDKWPNMYGYDMKTILGEGSGEGTAHHDAVCLNKRGVQDAKLLSQAIEQTGIKFSKVVSSPACRSMQTAELALGRVDLFSNALWYESLWQQVGDEGAKRALEALYASLDPKEGLNIALVGHTTPALEWPKAVSNGETLENNILEAGFHVLEKQGDKVYLRHTFPSLAIFMQNTKAAAEALQTPLNP